MHIGTNRKTLTISLTAAFTALVAVATLIIRIPIPATGGYINIGDALIFTAALSMGWFVGGVAGGAGSAIADMIGYPVFAPLTLVVKGLQGLLVGYIANGINLKRDVLAWIVGSLVMITGYFIGEAYLMQLGFAAALVEVPGNVSQVVVGGLIGLPLSRLIRKRLQPLLH